MKDCKDKVENPADRGAGKKPDDSRDKRYEMPFANAFYDTIDRPKDIDHGETEKDLHDIRKIVHKLTITHKYISFSVGTFLPEPFSCNYYIR